METKRSVAVTGDVVLDCHLYGGVKIAATSFIEPGATYSERLGGAALTYDLIKAASDAGGLAWDTIEKAWIKDNKCREKDGEDILPQPKALRIPRPEAIYATHLDVDTKYIKANIPLHLHSYSVWTDQPSKKSSKDKVWRIQRDFGYGPIDSKKPVFTYVRNIDKPSTTPILTVIDDGAMLFRNTASKEAWPELNSESWYLLKMSSPLCRGDLWSALAPVTNQLIVVVSAEDLRREDAQINTRLSWEMCVEHTLHVLINDPIACGLLAARHVIVSFGSAGALWVTRGAELKDINACLVFDPQTLENDYDHGFDGTVYGFQTCFVAGIAHHLMQGFTQVEDKPTSDSCIDADIMRKGITAGIIARRRLLELGHGPVGLQTPGLPVFELGQTIAGPHRGIVSVDIPYPLPDCQWTILQSHEVSQGDSPSMPLSGPAELTARYGTEALSEVPALSLGRLFTVDRSEIESLRTLGSLIQGYEDIKIQKKPLSIGVFGPPGAGKSFGVEALAKSILGEKVPFLEFNLSQFTGPEDLIGAFHRVRDAVLKGITPVAFWDEFDSRQYYWLQYLLAPMQDGAFQEGQITHPIGKCVFIFAGGTSDTIADFGVRNLEDIPNEELACLDPQVRRDINEQYNRFKLLKGPDFISRLHGYLNVLGPNRRKGTDCSDTTWPIRRALILRGLLGLGVDEELNIDEGLLNALLNVPYYRNGARSFEKIVKALTSDRVQNHLHRSALIPKSLLDRETDAAEFYSLLTERDAFKNHPEIEILAAVIHYNFLEKADQSILTSESNRAWKIHPAIQKDYDELTPDIKASNRAAARRIPDHLALIGFMIQPWSEGDGDSWKEPLKIAIEKHVDRLAQAEHLGWCAERIANGWVFGERDNDLKHHPSLVPWVQLPFEDKEKDHANVCKIPDLLELAKYKAVRQQDK